MTLFVSPSFLIPSLLYRCQISPKALCIYLTHTELTGHALKILQNAAAFFKLLSTLSLEAINHLQMKICISFVNCQKRKLKSQVNIALFTINLPFLYGHLYI